MPVDLEPPLTTEDVLLRTDPAPKLDDLAQIISAYNQVTEKLQHSHEDLCAEVVRLQDELASTDAQLQRTKRLAGLGEMAAGIAHEIRNPLAAIQLYANVLVDTIKTLPSSSGLISNGTNASMDHDVAKNVIGSAEKIASAVRGLNAVVSDVLSFARELTPKRQRVSADSLFHRAIDVQRPALEASQVDVVTPSKQLDLFVHVDPNLIHQALVNLIRNAIEAMGKGGTLEFGARLEGSQAFLTVRDSGPGIGQHDIDRIFNPFFTTRNSGTGLGLAIVHRIMDAHGGAIAVTNAQGAMFTLGLPQRGANDGAGL